MYDPSREQELLTMHSHRSQDRMEDDGFDWLAENPKHGIVHSLLRSELVCLARHELSVHEVSERETGILFDQTACSYNP